MSDPLGTTRESYDHGVQEYLAAQGPEPSPAARHVAELMPPGSAVLEIGSGPGRDARWLLGRGLRVQATDVADSFLGLLADLRPLRYDVATAPLPAGRWDAVLANAVLLHLPRAELRPALERVRVGVAPGTLLVASFTRGREDGWSHHTLDRPRWFTYWEPDDLRAAFCDTGWTVDEARESEHGLDRWVLVAGRAA